MSAISIPGIMCDNPDGCDDYAVDITLGGLATIDGSDTQLPPGWSGSRPGDRPDHHLCPRCTTDAAEVAT